MLALAIASSAIWNAFGYRFRGGLVEHWFGYIGGTQANRAAGALFVGTAVFALSGFDLYLSIGAFLLAMLGYVWTHYMPKEQGGMLPRTAEQIAGTSFFGGFKAFAPLMLGAFLAGLPWYWLLYPIILHGPLYYLAQLWQPYAPRLGLNVDKLPDPPALAEYYVGATLGAALALVLWPVSLHKVLSAESPSPFLGFMLPKPIWQYEEIAGLLNFIF